MAQSRDWRFNFHSGKSFVDLVFFIIVGLFISSRYISDIAVRCLTTRGQYGIAASLRTITADSCESATVKNLQCSPLLPWCSQTNKSAAPSYLL